MRQGFALIGFANSYGALGLRPNPCCGASSGALPRTIRCYGGSFFASLTPHSPPAPQDSRRLFSLRSNRPSALASSTPPLCSGATPRTPHLREQLGSVLTAFGLTSPNCSCGVPSSIHRLIGSLVGLVPRPTRYPSSSSFHSSQAGVHSRVVFASLSWCSSVPSILILRMAVTKSPHSSEARRHGGFATSYLQISGRAYKWCCLDLNSVLNWETNFKKGKHF